MITYLITFFLGGAVGIALFAAITHKKSSGTLKMDRTTGDPFMFLELKVPVSDLFEKETVQFDISREDHI